MAARTERLATGARVYFSSEKLPYTVQASGPRYAVCTKAFAARKTVLYTVVDRDTGVRGTEDLVFGMGAETREQCEEMLARLESGATEVSHRNRVPLDIVRVVGQGGAWKEETEG